MTHIAIDRTYPHPPSLVWRALTTSELLADWLMPNDFVPEVGHSFTFRTDPGPGFDGVVRCEVLELVAPTDGAAGRLVFSWAGGPIDTVVRFDVEETNNGTRLRVTQTGFRGVKAWLVAQILRAGSRTLYGKRLPALLDRLARGAQTSAPDPDRGSCMTPGQGAVVRTLEFMERGRSGSSS